MPDFTGVAAELSSRLPELEWQLSKLGAQFHRRLLPKHLFREASTPDDCIDEIKRDIISLSKQSESEQIQHYLATTIRQKISVLVHICQLHGHHVAPERPTIYDSMTTRAQWLEKLELARSKLLTQKEAILMALATMQMREQRDAILSLQLELGHIERELSALEEA